MISTKIALIKVEQKDGEQIVSALELYEFLKPQNEFVEWFKRVVKYCGLVESEDYAKIPFSKDYSLTLDCAKEIAMVQKTEKGKQAREYFLQCEKKANTLTPAEMLLQSAQMMVKLEREQSQQNERILALELQSNSQFNLIEAKVSNINNDYFSLSGYYRITKRKWDLSIAEAQKIGNRLKDLSNMRNTPPKKVPNSQYGTVNTYHVDILKEFFND